jgi:hypothetical protein
MAAPWHEPDRGSALEPRFAGDSCGSPVGRGLLGGLGCSEEEDHGTTATGERLTLRFGASVEYVLGVLIVTAGCHGKPRTVGQRTPAATPADATPSVADASDPVAAELAVNGPVWRWVTEWSSAIARHDLDALRAMYGERVSFYGRRRSSDDVIRAQQAVFAAQPDFRQEIPGFIDIARGVGDYYVIRFWKLSGRTGGLRGNTTKLVVVRGDGGPLLIVEEADDEASTRQNAACEETAADVINALPAVRLSVAQAIARAQASHGALRFGGIGPQDSGDPEGFSVSLGLNSDERFESVVSYSVDREGRLSASAASAGPVVVPPAALRKVERVCRR